MRTVLDGYLIGCASEAEDSLKKPRTDGQYDRQSILDGYLIGVLGRSSRRSRIA